MKTGSTHQTLFRLCTPILRHFRRSFATLLLFLLFLSGCANGEREFPIEGAVTTYT